MLIRTKYRVLYLTFISLVVLLSSQLKYITKFSYVDIKVVFTFLYDEGHSVAIYREN